MFFAGSTSALSFVSSGSVASFSSSFLGLGSAFPSAVSLPAIVLVNVPVDSLSLGLAPTLSSLSSGGASAPVSYGSLCVFSTTSVYSSFFVLANAAAA